MINKVCHIVNYNQYESKRHFTKKLAEAMEKKGIQTLTIDVNEGDLQADFVESIVAFQPDFTCSFNSLMPMQDKTFIWDLIKIPHLSFLVDPALYSVNLTASSYSLLSCVDRNDIAALKSFQFDRSFFMPHAIERDLLEKKNFEKAYDVVFFGSSYDYKSLQSYWRRELPKPQADALESAADLVFSDQKISLSQALVNVWNSSGLDFAEVDFLALFYFLDYYTRGRDRVELIRSIKDKHVHIFGELYRDTPDAILGWPQLLEGQNNVTIHPPVRYDQSFDLLAKSKICLNSMPFFRDGTHERIFMGLALGSLPLTSESVYLRESFKEGESLLYYQSNEKEKVNDLVNKYVADDAKREEIIASGKEIVGREHTWDQRVELLIDTFAE